VGAAPRNADFDFTMTKFWVKGRRGDSCHAVIDQSGLLAESFHERTTELRNHYYPLEVKSVGLERPAPPPCKRPATTELLQPLWRPFKFHVRHAEVSRAGRALAWKPVAPACLPTHSTLPLPPTKPSGQPRRPSVLDFLLSFIVDVHVVFCTRCMRFTPAPTSAMFGGCLLVDRSPGSSGPIAGDESGEDGGVGHQSPRGVFVCTCSTLVSVLGPRC